MMFNIKVTLQRGPDYMQKRGSCRIGKPTRISEHSTRDFDETIA